MVVYVSYSDNFLEIVSLLDIYIYFMSIWTDIFKIYVFWSFWEGNWIGFVTGGDRFLYTREDDSLETGRRRELL